MTAVTLGSGVSLVGGGWLGFGISDYFDCSVYMLSSNGESVVIDAGAGRRPQRICENIERIGVPPHSVSRILLTHAHADHAAGAPDLSARLDAEIWASELCADLVESADELSTGLAAARQEGVYPPDIRLRPGTIARRLGAESFPVGNVVLESFPTDGHSSGHLSYRASVDGRRIVFCGDLVFARGRIVLLNLPDSNPAVLASSIEALASWKPDVLLPGHGEVVLDGAGAHLDAALRRFEAGLLPESFVV